MDSSNGLKYFTQSPQIFKIILILCSEFSWLDFIRNYQYIKSEYLLDLSQIHYNRIKGYYMFDELTDRLKKLKERPINSKGDH